MYARHLTIRLKVNSAEELTRVIKNEIVPMLSKQKGFRDEILLVAAERSEAVATSFWDSKEDAEAYNRTGYPAVLKTLSNIVVGTPTIETYEVATLSFDRATASGA